MSTVTAATQILGYGIDRISEAIRSVGGSTVAAWEIAAKETVAEGVAYVIFGFAIFVFAQWMFRAGIRLFSDDSADREGFGVALGILGFVFSVVAVIVIGVYVGSIVAPNKALLSEVARLMACIR